MVKDITQARGEGQLADGTWVPRVLVPVGAVAELAPRQLPLQELASAAGLPTWRQREDGCSVCGWQETLGQCRLCRSWLCSDHRTMSHVPRQQKRRGGVDCQCFYWGECRVRQEGKS